MVGGGDHILLLFDVHQSAQCERRIPRKTSLPSSSRWFPPTWSTTKRNLRKDIEIRRKKKGKFFFLSPEAKFWVPSSPLPPSHDCFVWNRILGNERVPSLERCALLSFLLLHLSSSPVLCVCVFGLDDEDQLGSSLRRTIERDRMLLGLLSSNCSEMFYINPCPTENGWFLFAYCLDDRDATKMVNCSTYITIQILAFNFE